MTGIEADEGISINEYSRLFWAPIVLATPTRQTFKLAVSEAQIDGTTKDSNIVSMEPDAAIEAEVNGYTWYEAIIERDLDRRVIEAKKTFSA